MTVEQNLSYDDQIRERRFDLFLPNNKPNAPLIVMIHGGGWITGDRSMFHDEAAWFADKGFACACVAYRLAPLYPYPACVADLQAFMAHARQNAKNFAYDPGRIIAMGNSAGGHLACMAAFAKSNVETAEPAQTADAVVSISALSDLREPSQTQFPIAISFLEQFMDTTYFESPELYAQASPITQVTPDAPPALVIHGALDDVVPVEQSQALHDALLQAGAQSTLHILPHDYHAFSLQSWNQIRTLTLDFVTSL